MNETDPFLPAFVWHVEVRDPDNLVPHWHPREATYTDEAEARAHAELAERLGGDVTLYRAMPGWVAVAR